MQRREVEAMLNEVGLTLLDLTKKKHWKARVRRQDGSELIVSLPTSPSDRRALKNKRSQLRALALGA